MHVHHGEVGSLMTLQQSLCQLPGSFARLSINAMGLNHADTNLGRQTMAYTFTSLILLSQIISENYIDSLYTSWRFVHSSSFSSAFLQYLIPV